MKKLLVKVIAALLTIPVQVPSGAAEVQAGAAREPSGSVGSEWPMERVHLTDGRQYLGLIESENDFWLSFVQIQRLPGRPMHLVIRSIERKHIASIDRLDPSQRDLLRKRVEQFIQRAPIEAARIDAVPLEAISREGIPGWIYHGPWFSLETTADETTARRIVVRLEQVFTAYRQVLPPRIESPRPLRILAFGSMEEYRAFLDRLGLKIENQACYIEKENLVAAGSEVNRFTAELTKVRIQHDKLSSELDGLERRTTERLQELSQRLRRDGADKRETARLLTVEKRKTQEQIDRKQKEIAGCDRENQRLFDAVTRQMFAQLDHEAFHAYLENYVYPHGRWSVPLWLNEGLAVLFEGGLLESDALRIDAPNAAVLEKLRADLSGDRPMALIALLEANPSSFLSVQGAAARDDRYYLYAWGLAYYLTFEKHLLGSEAMSRYVEPMAEGETPASRFERLVGMPLDSFDRQWREYIQQLR